VDVPGRRLTLLLETMWTKRIRPAAVCGIMLFTLLASFPCAAAEEQPAVAVADEKAVSRINDVLAGAKTETLDEAWNAIETLKTIGKPAIPVLSKALDSATAQQKLIIGRALVDLGETKKATEVYTFLLADRNVPPEVRVIACRVVGMTPQLFGKEELMDLLRKALYADDPSVRIAAADTLLRFGKMNEAIAALMRLSSRKDSYGEEAALTLAENGYMAWVEQRLLEIWNKPTPNGRRAFLLLKSADTSLPGAALLKEVYDDIQSYYVDAEGLDKNKVVTSTARGMVSALDPFSSYLDEDDVKDMEESIGGRYGGIGAYVGTHNGLFTIISPIYDGPAYKVGLRSMDQVLEVGGQDTTKMRFLEVVKNLKGEPGTKIMVKIIRNGWSKPRDYTITREEITIDSVLFKMLPGNIGYMRLTRFGDTTTGESIKAIKQLQQEGAKAYILDLRDNGGGLLNEAVGVGDLLFDAGKLIVYSEGRPNVSARRDYIARTGSAIGDLPLVCLVNTGSASASEIVAGAIQDLKRGLLVGEKTYGKGSVQTIFDLSSTLFKTKVRLTIAKYYLPSGRCIHEKGVEPDIKVTQPEIQPWKIDALVELEAKVEEFVTKIVEEHPDIVEVLSEYDYHELSRYPGLEDFVKSIKDPRIESDDVRKYVRGVLRRKAADIKGKAQVVDVEEDVILRRGIFEALKAMGGENIPPEYATLAKEFPPEKETAAADKTEKAEDKAEEMAPAVVVP
jgi:carboxyl-terminal processing protease